MSQLKKRHESLKKKVLLMGRSGSGKTSMRSIIFANYLAKETGRLGPTLDVEHSHVKFLGNLRLNLWDCGGQNAFMDTYLESQREKIFKNVAVLIYVFDVKSDDEKRDMFDYDECLEAITQNSKKAKIFCLLHKMDLVPKEEREKVFKEKCKALQRVSGKIEIKCFQTSIWDETLYKCWSDITYSLIPNINIIEKNLDNFCRITGADEVVLFERATFLVIAYSTAKKHHDIHRFEKISNIIKQFKLSCEKGISQFQSMQVKNRRFKAFIEGFTPNTHIMVIVTDPEIQEATIKVNINVARKHFEKLWLAGEGPSNAVL